MNNLFSKQIINKNSAVPLYFQLYSYIEKLIENGTFKQGEHLPTEDELMKELGISRPTIRQAYKELELKGYIQRQRSKGTTVTKPKVFDKFFNTLSSFRNELEMRGEEVRTKVLDFHAVENYAGIAEILQSNKFIYLRRVRYSDNVPISYIETYVLYEYYEKLLEYDMESESLYAKMKEIKHPVTSVRRIISAGMPDKEAAKWLEMTTKEPILISKTTGFDADGKCVEYTVDKYNGAVSKFQVELELNADF